MSRRPIKPAVEQPIVPATVNDPNIVDKNKDLGGLDLGGGVDEDDILSPTTPTTQQSKKRKSLAAGGPGGGGASAAGSAAGVGPAKRPRTNTPWTAAEEQRLKAMRDAGNSWSEIAKTFPTRTEGSVKKHWYKACHHHLLLLRCSLHFAVSESRLMCRCRQDMHYAEFGEDEVRPAGTGAMAKSSLCRFRVPFLCGLVRADIKLQECCPSGGYQGIRRQQVEGDWSKSRKAGKGRRSVSFLHILNTRENAIIRFHHSFVDWNRPNQNFTGLRTICQRTLHRQIVQHSPLLVWLGLRDCSTAGMAGCSSVVCFRLCQSRSIRFGHDPLLRPVWGEIHRSFFGSRARGKGVHTNRKS
jgi:hypothetical protein